MRVLLIDDESTIREVISTALSLIAGHEVLACASALEGCAKASAFQPELLMIDLMMPEIDGIDALDAVRALPGLEHVPVVFISATVDPRLLERARRKRPLAMLEKPLDVRTIGVTIERLCKAAQLH